MKKLLNIKARACVCGKIERFLPLIYPPFNNNGSKIGAGKDRKTDYFSRHRLRRLASAAASCGISQCRQRLPSQFHYYYYDWDNDDELSEKRRKKKERGRERERLYKSTFYMNRL